jgi:hypothetical protein
MPQGVLGRGWGQGPGRLSCWPPDNHLTVVDESLPLIALVSWTSASSLQGQAGGGTIKQPWRLLLLLASLPALSAFVKVSPEDSWTKQMTQPILTSIRNAVQVGRLSHPEWDTLPGQMGMASGLSHSLLAEL